MSKTEAKAPVPFSVMSGDGEPFVVGEKTYTVSPILVGDALKFADEGLFIGSQIFNLGNKESRVKLDTYLSQYCTDENSETMSIEKISADKWSVVDLKLFVRKLCDISG